MILPTILLFLAASAWIAWDMQTTFRDWLAGVAFLSLVGVTFAFIFACFS